MRTRRQFLIVVKSDGQKLIPDLPVTLNTGDQLLLAREQAGSEVPSGESWLVKGYTDSGPIVTKTRED